MDEKRGSLGANEKGLDQACHRFQSAEMTARSTVLSTFGHQQLRNHKAAEGGIGK